MFAPPMPPSGSRRPSAVAHNSYAHHPYNLPSSSSPMEQQHIMQDRRISYAGSPSTDERRRSSLPPPRPIYPEDDHVEVASQTQDHMNVVTKHPKVKIEVVLDSPIFEAGGSISGRIELTCTSSQRLRLGELAIELEAVEQLSSRDHAATQLFLYNRTMFQGDSLPPSNAVIPSAPINGYWTARKGRTSFAFSFRVPSSAPSCVNFAGNANLRYGLKATVQTWYNDEKMVVTARRQAFVLEKWNDVADERFLQPVNAVSDTRLFMGGNGTVLFEAGVTEQLFWAGGQMLIRCGIKNNTKRHLTGIKVSLARRLIYPVGSPEGIHDTPGVASLEPKITELAHEQTFKGREYEFGANEESVCNVVVDIPKDIRTIRKTRLFEVRIFAMVSLMLGSLAKDLAVEIPIYVVHTASAQPPARHDLLDLHRPPPQAQIPHRPRSSVGHIQPPSPVDPSYGHAQLQYHNGAPAPAPAQMVTDPRMLEIEQLAASRGWSPAPIFDSTRPTGPPVRSASAAPGMIQLPIQPFSMSPGGQVDWDKSAGAWNLDPFMTSVSHEQHIPRAASAAPDMVQHSIARPTSAGPSVPMMYAHPVPPISWMPNQQSGTMQQQQQQQQHHHHHQDWQQQQQARRASLPVSGPQESVQAMPFHPAMPAMNQAMPVFAPAEPQHASVDPQSEQLLTAQPPTGFFPPPVIAGLATIEEDSESQAGTIKTMRNLPTLSKTGTKGGKGNSVSRNNIEHFEAMAEAEEDEEEVKRQMIAMGMQPDENFFSVRSKVSPVNQDESRAEQTRASHNERTDAPASLSSSTRRSSKTQSASANANRPRAIDVFNTSSLDPDFGSDSTDEWKAHHAELTKTAQIHEAVKATPSAGEASEDRRTSLTSLRRTSSSQGSGLEALESKLHRTTTPKLSSTASGSSVMVLGNVGRRESVPSPLVAASSRDDSTRSRKDSALRAAALAREEAERKALEEEARASEERARRREAEEAARAEEARAEAARRDAERARLLENERIERERIAERARIERQRAERQKADQEAKEQEESRARQQQIEQEQARLAQLEEQRLRREEAAALAAAEAAQLRLQQHQDQEKREREQQRLKEEAEAEQRRNSYQASSPARFSQNEPDRREHRLEAMSSPSNMYASNHSRFHMPESLSSTSSSSHREATAAMPRSHTMANVASGPTSTKMETTLSADLRALIDSAGAQPARKAGTALKDHPITRKISVTDRPEHASQDSIGQKADRRTSVPAWPRPGLSSYDSRGKASSLASAFSSQAPSSSPHTANRAEELFSAAEKAIVVPTRVEKTLKLPEEPRPNTLSVEGEKAYDTRSARGGRGGRVASVAQLWSRIAGDDETDDAIADKSSADVHKPHARRTSAPALDFSKKKLLPASLSGVTGLAVQASGRSCADLKGANAPHFLNTSSTGKAVFSTAPSSGTEGARRPLPMPVTPPGSKPAPQLVRPTAMRANSSQQQHQTSSVLDSRSVRDMMSKVAVDPTVLQALQGDYSLDMDLSTLRLADGTEVKMSGRGTTKAIGNGKLNSLRAVWGS